MQQTGAPQSYMINTDSRHIHHDLVTFFPGPFLQYLLMTQKTCLTVQSLLEVLL